MRRNSGPSRGPSTLGGATDPRTRRDHTTARNRPDRRDRDDTHDRHNNETRDTKDRGSDDTSQQGPKADKEDDRKAQGKTGQKEPRKPKRTTKPREHCMQSGAGLPLPFITLHDSMRAPVE